MYVHVEFDTGQTRDIPVSNGGTFHVVDGDQQAALSFQGLTCLYLTSDTGETSVGPDLSAEAVARSIGWVPVEHTQRLEQQIGERDAQIGQMAAVIRELQRNAERDYPVTVAAGGGEPGLEAARIEEARAAAALNEQDDRLAGSDAVWADDEPPVAA